MRYYFNVLYNLNRQKIINVLIGAVFPMIQVANSYVLFRKKQEAAFLATPC